MTKDELITKQQLEIEQLKNKNSGHKKRSDTLHNILYCIGGPLNDNKQRFTKDQLVIFINIKHLFWY